MTDFDAIQDAVNSYFYLEENPSIENYKFVIDFLSRSCNPFIVNTINNKDISVYSKNNINNLRKFLYSFIKRMITQFMNKIDTESYTQDNYGTILITVIRLTDNNYLKELANDLLNKKDMEPHLIYEVCKKFLDLS